MEITGNEKIQEKEWWRKQWQKEQMRRNQEGLSCTYRPFFLRFTVRTNVRYMLGIHLLIQFFINLITVCMHPFFTSLTLKHGHIWELSVRSATKRAIEPFVALLIAAVADTEVVMPAWCWAAARGVGPTVFTATTALKISISLSINGFSVR